MTPAQSLGTVAVPPVTAVLAARNEAATIADVVHRTAAALPPGSEILVVDDGSTDGTAALAADAGASVLVRAAPHGKGRALRDGIAAAQGAILVFLDADGQDPPEELPRLLDALAAGADLANGSKFLGECRAGALRPGHRAGNQLMTRTANALFGTSVTDSQSGFRAIRAERLRGLCLRATEYEIETEVLLRGLRAGWRVVEVPVTRERRAAGSSGFRKVRNGLRILATIVAIRIGAW